MTRAAGAALLCVLGGALLRAGEAFWKSLWLDEFHTLAIARAKDIASLLERLLPDFHPPLFFLGVHALRDVDAHVLRAFPAIANLLTLPLLWSIARAGGLGPLARVVTIGTFCFLPFQIQYGTELRPYALLQFWVVLMVWVALSADTKKPRGALFFLATVGGLYTHYLAGLTLLALGAVRMLWRSPRVLSFRGMLIAGTLGVAAFVPWVIYDESWVFSDPGVMLRTESVQATPELDFFERVRNGFVAQARDFAMIFPRSMAPLTFVQKSDLARRITQASLAVLALVLVVGFGNWVLRRRTETSIRGSLVASLSTALVAFVFTAVMCAGLWARVPLQYFSVFAWSWPLALGVAVQAAPRPRLAATLVLGSALAAGGVHVLSESREDLRGGVVGARQEAGARPVIYTALLRQAPYYPHTIVYEEYGQDLHALEPENVPAVGSNGGDLDVIVVTRFTPLIEEGDYWQIWKRLIEGRRVAKTITLDKATQVVVLSRL